MTAVYVFIGVFVAYLNIDAAFEFIDEGLRAIPPHERKLTKYRWVRVLMYLGGCVTIMVVLVGYGVKRLLAASKRVGVMTAKAVFSDLY
mgnify:CR=1 FL=1